MRSTEQHAEDECASAVVAARHGVLDAGELEIMPVMLHQPQNSRKSLRDRAGPAELADGIGALSGLRGIESPFRSRLCDHLRKRRAMQKPVRGTSEEFGTLDRLRRAMREDRLLDRSRHGLGFRLVGKKRHQRSDAGRTGEFI